jgi:hypothetical protein
VNDDDGTSADTQAVPHPVYAETAVVVGVTVFRFTPFVNTERDVHHQEIQSVTFGRVPHSSTSFKVEAVEHRPRLSRPSSPEHK